MAEKKNILETIGSTLLAVPKAVAGGVNEVAMAYHDPDYQRRTQEAESQKNLNSKLQVLGAGFEAAKQYGGMNSPEGLQAFNDTLSQLGQPELAKQYANLKVGKPKPRSSDLAKLFPDGSPAQAKMLQNVALESGMGPVSKGFVSKPQDGQVDIDRIGKLLELQEKNIDASTGEPNSAFADIIAAEISRVSGIPKERLSGAKAPNLADLLGGYPQDTDRTFMDNTISPDNVKQAAKNAEQTLIDQGYSREEARKMVRTDYASLAGEDDSFFQKYPKMDIAQLFVDEDNRQEAVATGKTVIDTGDGISTVPQPYSALGINDPDSAEQFADLETIVGKSMPDFDLRGDYQKDPAFYQQLLTAIKDGVPDSKRPGEKRKLSMQEIIDIIRG